MATTNRITDAQIRTLRREAAEAGDIVQTVICDLATGDLTLDGDESTNRLAQVTDTYPVLTREECRRVADMTEEEARAACAEAIARGSE